MENCLSYVFERGTTWVMDELVKAYVNTKIRVLNDLQMEKNANGLGFARSSQTDKSTFCKFKLVNKGKK